MAARESQTEPDASGNTADPNAETAENQENGPIVHVTASASRRRIGCRFPEGQAIPVKWDELSEEERDALMADPVLQVTPKE